MSFKHAAPLRPFLYLPLAHTHAHTHAHSPLPLPSSRTHAHSLVLHALRAGWMFRPKDNVTFIVAGLRIMGVVRRPETVQVTDYRYMYIYMYVYIHVYIYISRYYIYTMFSDSFHFTTSANLLTLLVKKYIYWTKNYSRSGEGRDR